MSDYKKLIEEVDTREGRMGIYAVPDEDPQSPRDWDNLGTMGCWHRRSNLGDQQISDPREWVAEMAGIDGENDYWQGRSAKELWEAQQKAINDKYIWLPLNLYEHSGMTMSTGRGYPFNDQWDAGQVGFIWVSKEKVRKEYGWKLITAKREKQILTYLEGEVERYDDYLTGNVWGYRVMYLDDVERDIHSCWGYFGDYDKSGLLEDARACLQYEINRLEGQWREQLAAHYARVKSWIKNKVPMIYRQPNPALI